MCAKQQEIMRRVAGLFALAEQLEKRLAQAHRQLIQLTPSLLARAFADILRKLREQPGILGDIFAQATPRFNNPVNLKRVIAMIDEEDWSAMDVDVKDAAFEGLLEKAASEGKKGAGQQLPAVQALRSGFAGMGRALARIAITPRPLIQTICRVMKPDPRGNPDFRLCDPACGTGGFLVCAWEWREVDHGFHGFHGYFYFSHPCHPRNPWFHRLALMNLFLHGVEPHIALGDTIYEPDRGDRFDCVLTKCLHTATSPSARKAWSLSPEEYEFVFD